MIINIMMFIKSVDQLNSMALLVNIHLALCKVSAC